MSVLRVLLHGRRIATLTNVGGDRTLRKFDRSELAHLAAGALVPESIVLEAARETVARFREAWAAETGRLPFAPAVVAAIEAHLPTIPLLADR